MSLPRSILLLLAAAGLAGCASKVAKEDQLDPRTANSRAIEQRRVRVMADNEDQGVSARGAEIAVPDPDKTFDPGTARFGQPRSVSTKSAHSTTFNFVDRVRTKEFTTREHVSKTAWMGDVQFQTKAAPVRDSWFSRMTARTRTFGTRTAPLVDKSATTRALPGIDKPYVAKGRKQALYDTNGPSGQAMGSVDGGQSWSGDLKQLSIQDVKNLLNKN